MKIQEVISILEDYMADFPNAEVKVAFQPSRPMEADIVRVAMRDAEPGDQTEEGVVWLGSSSYHTYLDSAAREQLGWPHR